MIRNLLKSDPKTHAARKSRRRFVAAAIGLCVASTGVKAQSSDVFTLIVPFPAGGPADAIARNMHVELQTLLGRTIVIENVPGAGGALGAQRMLAAGPNSRTALIATVDDLVLTPLSLASVRYKASDLRMVTTISRSDYALVSRSGLDVDLRQLLTNKPPLTNATMGQGHVSRLAMEDFKARTGVNLTAVPYKGVANLVTDLLGQVVDLAFVPLAGSTPGMIEQGNFKLLAVAAPARVRPFPKAPVFNEVLSEKFEYASTPSVFVHRDTPQAFVDTLNAAVEKIKATSSFVQFTEGTASTVMPPMSSRHADAFYLAEQERYSSIAKTVRLEPQ